MTDKCENCGKEGQAMIDISNFTVTYTSCESFNCCCEECAKQAAIKNGVEEHEIDKIE